MNLSKRQKMIFYGCFIAYVGAYIGRLNSSAALPGLMEALKLTGEQGGMLQTVFALTYAAGQMVNGAIVDRISAKRFILFGLLGSAVCNLIFGISSAYPVLLAAWCLNGAAQSMLWTPIVKLVAGWFHGSERGKISFRISVTCVLGHLAAWAIAGYMAKIFSWRLSFVLPAVVLGAVAVASWLLLEDEPKQEPVPGEKAASAARMPMGRLLVSNGLWMMLLCCVCNGFVRDGVMTWGPSILDDVGSTTVSSVTISLVIPVANLFGIVIGRLFYMRAAGNSRRAIGLMMLMGAAVAVALQMLGMNGMVLCALLLGLLCAVMYGVNPLLTTLLPMEYDSAGRVGMVAGLVDCFIYLGSSLTGVLTGVLHDASGWQSIFVVWMAVSVAGAALGMLSGLAARKKA